MGKTKTIIIDDSKPTAEVKKTKKSQNYEKTIVMDDSAVKSKLTKSGKSESSKKEDSLVTKLREELGIEDNTERAKVGAASRLSEADEVSSESTSTDVHEPDRAGSEQSEEAELEKQTQPSEGSRKTKKPGKAKPRSKKYLEATKTLDRSKTYPLPEALDMVKKMFYAKFNGTLEIHINTVQTGLRGFASLPYASGRKLKLLVFAKAGEDFLGAISGNESTISEIEQGKAPYDVIIATPDWMSKLAKIAKILGPRGLLPNPKNGTITDDPKKAVESFQSGKVEFKTEAKAPVIHVNLGKLDQPNEELEANVKTLLGSIGKSKIKKITLAPTMGPGVKLDLTSI